MTMTPYIYRVVEIIKIYDGDTITVILDLGMNIHIKKTIRFLDIDTPEIRGEERPQGLISREWLVNKLENAKEIYIQTHKDKTGKYGRLLGTVYIDDEIKSINEQLVEKGLAEYKSY